jgi:peptide/nickel transport system substrate-binding protein
MQTMPAVSKERRGLATLALGVAAMTVLAGCSGSTSEAPQANENGLGTAEISLAVNSAPASLDPAFNAEGQQGYVWASIYDNLVIFDNEGALQPNAAKSWEYSEDLLSLTMTLRDDLTFADGDPITAEAAAATADYIKNSTGPNRGAFQSLESVEATDERTVVYNLTEPDPSFLPNLASAAGVIADPETLGDEANALEPLASGPYTMAESTVAGSSYVLERRDDHWNAEAYPFKNITVRVIQDRTAVFNALQAGELTAGTVQPDQAKALEGAGNTTVSVPATANAGLVILDREGTIQPALSEVKVRQALNMAFRRDDMVKQLLQGAGTSTVQLFNPQSDAYDSELEGTYEYDPEGAKELLAEAGYPDGFEVTMPSTVISMSFEPTITQALSDIGVKVTWEPVPPQNTAAAVTGKQYPMVFFIDGLNVPSKMVRNNLQPTSFLNPFGWTDPELDGLLDEAAMTTDDAAQNEAYKKVSKFFVDNALNAPLFYVGTTWSTADGIEYLGDGSNAQSTIRAFGVTTD